MSRQRPTPSTIRALFAKSGNVCAFPECEHKLVEDDNLYVGEICHIEAAEPRGPRYNPDSTEDERRSYNNLMLLCHAHHRRIDSDAKTYTVTCLRSVKTDHEELVSDIAFQVDSAIISQVEREMDSYWVTLLTLQRGHPIPKFAIEVKPKRSGIDVFEELRARTRDIEDLLEHYRRSDELVLEELKDFLKRLDYDVAALESVPYYENPFVNRNWEFHNIGSRNRLLHLQTLQRYAELLYLVEYEKHHAGDTTAAKRRKAVMNELSSIAASAAYAD